MSDLSVFFYFLKEKIMFQNYLIKSDHRVLRKNYGAPVFAPDYSATGLVAKVWTNSQWAFYVYKISMLDAD
jgi:hypothetical protein